MAKIQQTDKAPALSLGQLIAAAQKSGRDLSDVIIAEACEITGQSRGEVLEALGSVFAHNLRALELGISTGESMLLGRCAFDLAKDGFRHKIFNDVFVNKALVYTLGAQVGNHSIGLEPCAGTGDSCSYTGMYRAIGEEYGYDAALKAAAIMLKIGTIFRIGKTTTGCNMEGLGAGAAAGAAALTALWGGSPEQAGKAVVLALSATIAVPCTPRVMVPGLCVTHIGGAVLLSVLAAKVILSTDIPVNVPVDVMIALAADAHKISAKHVVPSLIRYLQPYFKTNDYVERYVDAAVKIREAETMHVSTEAAMEEAARLAADANPITKPFGEAVVGGSSQAVGSPTNAGRIAHALAHGEIRSVKIELYPELFARRGINVPGILMGAVYGAGTDDYVMYENIMDKVLTSNLKVEVLEIDTPQTQRVTIETDEGIFMVDTSNRGGGRLKINDALPSLQAAKEAAILLRIVEA